MADTTESTCNQWVRLTGTTLREVVGLPNPKSLDQIVFNDIGSLSEHRIWLDHVIVNWIAELSESDQKFIVRYHHNKGFAATKRYSSLVLHFFNHQTHHRGQMSTLLAQASVDIVVTDLLAEIPEEMYV